MPEIKNTPSTSPSPERHFILPTKRRFSAWHFVVPVLLIIALAGGWFAHALIPNATAPEANVIEQDDEDETPLQTKAYYSTTDNEGKLTHIYSYSGLSNVPDVKVGDIQTNALSISGKYLDPYTYIVGTENGKVQVLNAMTAKLTPLFDIEPKALMRETAISSDKKWLAYGLNTEGTPNYGEIWLYNIETKEKKQLVKKTELGTYQGFSILGWRNDDQELIVSSLGGDAGAVWGDIYQVNAVTGELTKVAPVEKGPMNYFIRGVLSPDSGKWLFTYCDKPEVNPTDQFAASEPCTSGAELRAYDFATKKINKVYQNIGYDNNVDKNMLRSILSFIWQDDKTIVAAVPGVILEISTTGSEPIELVTFDRYNPQNFKNNYISIMAASKERIVFSRENGPQVFDRVSKKIEVLNLDGRNENLSSWLD
jgi:hypothetical protein